MADLRRDPITGRWVIIDTDRPKGPQDYEAEQHPQKSGVCAFCPGNEGMTPPEITGFSKSKRAPDTPDWTLRVVPNKYPALQINGALDKTGIGAFDLMNGIGAHEVIIETISHDAEVSDRPEWEIMDLIWAYRDRSLDLRKDERFKYVLIFKNFGRSAGASLSHPHSQLISLPFTPKKVIEELNGAKTYFDYRGRCVFCDMINQEMGEGKLTVVENKNFLSFCPFDARFPYETWIIPREHLSDFGQIQLEQVSELALVLKDTLSRIKTLLKNPAYNYIVHTSPLDNPAREEYHWHIEIMPKLSKVAGFEWGTGFYINTTPPELAARTLRDVK
ncbi:MAG: galactose-1-phosphate uridylyltransferase [Candidatus Omnitrophica bacterium]|nr:galactose-1-phosphate uridylyltransferase [Candidatus Omnitrophota bacterium]